MIKAKDILRSVRFKEKDNSKVKFSDYDIKYAMNEALRYIGQSQALQNSDFLIKEATFNEYEINKDSAEDKQISFQRDGVELPEDYQILVGVTRMGGQYSLKPCDVSNRPHYNEYKVMNNRIYSGSKFFKLTYKRTLDGVKDLKEDEIDLPTFCTELVVKITILILEQAETDVLLQQIESFARAIIPRRRFNNIETKMPFYC